MVPGGRRGVGSMPYKAGVSPTLDHMNMNIALRRFLHNHGNIATEGSPKPGLCPTLILNDFKGSL